MSDLHRNVALVGRPNVGKSRLFNRLLGRRSAIVHDMPGVTRDLSAAWVDSGGYTLMDTGGIGLRPESTPEVIHAATEEQVDFAIAAAALVLFVVEASEGPTGTDFDIAERLRRAGKVVVVVGNKADRVGDSAQAEAALAGFGFKEAILVSAEHNRGIAGLEACIHAHLGPPPPRPALPERTQICLFGRPNVGKSSLGNALLQSSRLIVSEVSGTTREAVEHDFDYLPDGAVEPWRFRLIDTAGLRPKRKLSSSVEYFSNLRTVDALERCDIAVLVLEAMSGVTKHDKKIAGDALAAGKGLIVVVNKWDQAREQFRGERLSGYETLGAFEDSFHEALERELFFVPGSPVVFLSAREGFAIEALLRAARELDLRMAQPLPTPKLNTALRSLMERNPPRLSGGKRLKVYYAVQVGTKPFRIRAYCNRATLVDDGYMRYLLSGLRERFDLAGCPVKLEFVGKPRDENPFEPKASAPPNKGKVFASGTKKASTTRKRSRRG